MNRQDINNIESGREPILRLAMRWFQMAMNQAGGLRVFKKLDPERFPLSCGEGVLPPVLFSSPVPVRPYSGRQRRR